MQVIYDCLSMVAPQIMKLMIDFVEENASPSTKGQTHNWQGYLYGLLLLAATVTQSITLGQYFEKMYIVAMNVRTTMISTIYRKSLRMSNR